MSSILKMRVPFYRRNTNGGGSGITTFYLTEFPAYLPEINQSVLISHTDVPTGSGLYTKLTAISSNTVTGIFQGSPENATPESILQSDGYSKFFTIQYTDTTFSLNQYGGDCRGYIEYDVNPSTYNILKPIESKVIVNETVPFDLLDGHQFLEGKFATATDPGTSPFLKGMLVKRNTTNSIFANLLKSLNLPVSDEEMKKYTRSPLGKLSSTTSSIYDTIISGTKYTWAAHTTTGATTDVLVVHPTTGYTGEHYGTVLQTIGSYEYKKTDKSLTPVTNEMFLIYEIPNSAYGEIIDGKSIKLTIPYYTGTTNAGIIDEKLGLSTYTGLTQQLTAYGTYNKNGLNAVNLDRVLSELDLSVKDIGIRPDIANSLTYESNVVLLFSDTIASGTTNSWADGHTDIMNDVRVFNPASVIKSTYDYKTDECIGFVALDKGFIVITHPKIVDSYFSKIFGGTITATTASIATATKYYDFNTAITGEIRGAVKTWPERMLTTSGDTGVLWESTQFVYTGSTTPTGITSDVEYISYNTEKSLNIVCLASSDEFFKSTNDTAKELLGTALTDDYSDFKAENQNLYPVMITQIGIHDVNGELLAICKPVMPIKKYWYDITSFVAKIRL